MRLCMFVCSLLCIVFVAQIDSSQAPNEHPIYIKPVEASNLQCSDYFEPNAKFDNYEKHRLTYKDPQDETLLPMDCNSIKERSYFQVEDLYPEEREFPIAYARTVFKDYRFIEMELAASYAPQNFYCYALDAKSSPLFQKRMKALASCFPNVHLTKKKYNMDRAGHNMTRSQYECMKLLTKKEMNWKYLFLLQNHDVMLKTNQELIQILKWYNGTNGISAYKHHSYSINTSLDWTFKALHLFKDESQNLLRRKRNPRVHFVKSSAEGALSRAMVDFMVEKLNPYEMMMQFDSKKYGVDEFFIASINSDDNIQVPGGFTRHCLKKHKLESNALVRLVHWRLKEKCKSNFKRHGVCMLTMEYLSELSNSPFLLANKMMPGNDFGAIACWHEKLFNRTHLERGIHRLNAGVYLNLPQVRYNRERNELGDKFDLEKFNCSTEFEPC